MRLKLLAIVALLVVAGGAIGMSTGIIGSPAASATTLLTSPATVTDVTDEVAATGTVTSTESWALAFGAEPWLVQGESADTGGPPSSVTWPVTEVKVAVGDRVAQGDLLASAATTELETAILAATRQANSAEIQYQIAKENREDASTTDERRQTQMALYNAADGRDKAAAELAELVAQRQRASLTAPIAGVVTAVSVRSGTDAPSGAAITIASATLRVSSSVVESDVENISLGQGATVTIDAIDASLSGTVAAISPVADAGGNGGVVSYAVEVSLAAPPASLRAGMSADVTIVTATAEDVLAIPSRALSGGAGNYTVRVVAADGTVEARAVTVGLVTASLAEVRSGLQAGEQVVTGTSSTQDQLGLPGGGGTVNVGGPGVIRKEVVP